MDAAWTPLLIPAGNPGPMTGAGGNNTWLIDGAAPTLIDAGVGASTHIDALERALAGRPLVRVLVTHGHADHASGVPALRARWPDVEIARWHEAPALEAHHVPLHDGDRIAAGDGQLIVVYTPGHAVDHVVFWDPDHAVAFTGDLVISGTTVMIPAGRGGSLRAYLASLDRIASLRPARLYPGHGPVIDQPQSLIAAYRAHRAMRERQILSCLRDGIRTVDDIVARIYPDVTPAIIPAARMTVEAHLAKIKEDKTEIRE